MNSIIQLILLSIFVTIQVRGDLHKTKKNVEEFHSMVIEKVKKVLNCENSGDDFHNGICIIISEMEPKFKKIKETKLEGKLKELFGELAQMIIEDFNKFKDLISGHESGTEEMKKSHEILSKGIRTKSFKKNEVGHKLKMAGSHHEINKINQALDADVHKSEINFLKANIASLEAHLTAKAGHLDNADMVNKLAADCIVQLEKVIEGTGHVDLNTAFSVFSTELLVYATKIPAIAAEVKKMQLHIEFH